MSKRRLQYEAKDDKRPLVAYLMSAKSVLVCPSEYHGLDLGVDQIHEDVCSKCGRTIQCDMMYSEVPVKVCLACAPPIPEIN